MHPIRLLAKVQPKHRSLLNQSGGQGPSQTLTDVALALAGLDHACTQWAYYHWCHDQEQYAAVLQQLLLAAKEINQQQQWQLQNRVLNKLCCGTLIWLQAPPCRHCLGEGFSDDNHQQVCRYCEGSGHQPRSLKRCCNIRAQSWDEHRHAAMVNELIGVIGSWEHQILSHMKRKLMD